MTAIEFDFSINQASIVLKPFALKLTKDLDDAKDLLQDTLMKAILNKDKFSDGTNLKAWLFTIMKNTFLNNHKKTARLGTSCDPHSLNSVSHATGNNALNLFASEEIRKAIENVDDSFKTPFMMFVKGFKYQEIADDLKIPVSAVRSRIHIARIQLRHKLHIYANLSIN